MPLVSIDCDYTGCLTEKAKSIPIQDVTCFFLTLIILSYRETLKSFWAKAVHLNIWLPEEICWHHSVGIELGTVSMASEYLTFSMSIGILTTY